MSEIFSKRLKEVREVRGLSQAELAKKTRLQATAISHFETGARAPSFDNLRRLADALNVSTDYLIGRSNDLAMAGPETDSLFRGLENLSEADLGAIRMMKEALLARKKEADK
jgi:transcriptional regulator with XRE-family HTH domain